MEEGYISRLMLLLAEKLVNYLRVLDIEILSYVKT